MDLGEKPLNLLAVSTLGKDIETWITADLPLSMPVAFGPMPGPRQNVFGAERAAAESTFTTGKVVFHEVF
jgi:hypothetical protein